MRVLMFGWEFPPHIAGGLGTACQGLTRGLLHQGVDVTFVLPKLFGGEGEGRMRMLSAEDVGLRLGYTDLQELHGMLSLIAVDSYLMPYLSAIDVETLHTTPSTRQFNISHWASQQFRFSGSYGPSLMDEVARYALVAAAIARQQEFDIIHAHDWLTYLAGLAAKRITGKPLVVHIHATEFDRSGEHVNQAVYDIERQGLHGADMIIAVSYRTRDTVINRYGIDPKKVIAIHNAVDFTADNLYDHITPPYPEKVVTFLGRITFQKGPDYFVEAAHRVLQHDGNVRFVMAGSGDMLHRMILRVAQLGIADRFHFAGFLRGAEVDRMYRMSDVYVMPSVSEPFGITPLEAMRNLVPVIISKQSGVAEVLRYAIKINFWDIDAMADAIYGLLHYPALAEFFKRYGQQEVIALKWDSAALHIKQIYQDLLGQ